MPAKVPKPGKDSATARMLSQLPELSLMPTTCSGKSTRSRLMSSSEKLIPVSWGKL